MRYAYAAVGQVGVHFTCRSFPESEFDQLRSNFSDKAFLVNLTESNFRVAVIRL